MYCSFFTYCEDQARQRQQVTQEIAPSTIVSRIENAERGQQISNGVAETIKSFLAADDGQQRHLLDDSAEKSKNTARTVIKAFFEILEKLRSDQELIYYALCHLDGILEDARSRVTHFIEIMNHFKDSVNLIKILIGFLQNESSPDNRNRDIASHILAILIESQKKENEAYMKDSTDFLNWL